MRFTRAHKHNRVQYQKGDSWRGSIAGARSLYYRDVLEPDGAAIDEEVMLPRHSVLKWSREEYADRVSNATLNWGGIDTTLPTQEEHPDSGDEEEQEWLREQK